MRKFVKNTGIALTALTVMVVGLLSAGCGTGGPGESPASVQVPAAATDTPPVSKQLALAWDEVVGATSYNLYWSTVPGVTPATGMKISSAGTSYVHTGLAPGTTYYYVVTAANGNSESAASAQTSGITSP